MLAHPQLVHPILKSPTFPTFKLLSSLICIQNTDLDMPTPKQATTHISLLPHVDKKISNAFRNMSCISTPMKRTILQYRTGTLYNQKHAVRFKRSTNPPCPLPDCHQLGSTLHMISGCRNDIILTVKTERHNVAGRMIIKALSKSPLGAGLVNTDIGSDDRLAQHILQFPANPCKDILRV